MTRLLALTAGLITPAAAFAQPASTNLGTLTPGVPVNFNTGGTAANQTKWWKFTLAQPVSYQALRFLDIRTNNSGLEDDAQIAVYNSSGQRIATDNDDWVNFDAQLTFGTGEGFAPLFGGGSTPNGRDGDLPAGTYYLGITRWEATFNATAFGVTPDPLPGAAADVEIVLGDTVAQAPAVFTDLGTLAYGQTITRSDSLAGGEVRWYKVVLPSATAAAGTFVDIDTEGSLLAPANDTRLRLYGVNGAIQSVVSIPDGAQPANNVLNDDDDGSGLLSQFTFGTGSPARPAVGDGLAYNGRDGALRPGIYYIAASSVPTTPVNYIISGAANFGTTSTSGNTGTLGLRLSAGTTANTSPTGTGVLVPNWASVSTSNAVLRVTVTPGANPASTGLAVSVDTASLGGGVVNLRDDGVAPDTTANDLTFNGFLPVPAGAPVGAATVPFTITDAQARTGGGNIGFTVFGPPPGCSPGGDAVSGVNIPSEGPAGDASNGVLTISPASPAAIGSITLSGRYIPNDFFAFEASLQIIPPGGSPVLFFPINDFDNAGRPRDVSNLSIPLPCPIPGNAGAWTFRFYELSNTSAGNDGVWTDVCVTLVPDTADPTRWNADRCAIDAGELLASAQVPAGAGPLNTILGNLEPEGTDLYKIEVCDVDAFSASTQANTGFDSQIFLFDSAGVGVMFNDNIAAVVTQSTINNGGGLITTPGVYYLAISAYDRDPGDSTGEGIWSIATPRTGINPPDGLAAATPLTTWNGFTGGIGGNYQISLTGVCYPSTSSACSLADVTDIGNTGAGPDGILTVDDIITFVNTFGDATGCPGVGPCNLADVTDIGNTGAGPDGELTVDDIIAFVNTFGEGCPG
jgi:hypothetical protein